MIRLCLATEFSTVLEIINDAAIAYKGVIPADRWHEPYMSESELLEQIRQGVVFWCFVERDSILGVMGIQDRVEVTLIRHAYVRTDARNKGIGGRLLKHLIASSTKPVLIGTWADATWAITFYLKHGFGLLSKSETLAVLPKYWNIPERQIETSVVLASADWIGHV
jgi:GNAT superfamily N-acetyltransferase